MRAVNLLPRDEQRASFGGKSARVAVAGTVGFVLVSALLVTSMLSASGSLSEKQNTLENLRTALTALPHPSESDASADAQLAGEKAQRIAALAGALGGRLAWDRVLREVSLVLPDDVWLTALTATSPAAAAAAAATAPAGSAAGPVSGFSLSGATYSHAAVARLLSRLAVVPDLENVALVSAATAKVGEKAVIQFTIAASVKAGVAS
jgi:Tfp pilus assembly protein PilN